MAKYSVSDSKDAEGKQYTHYARQKLVMNILDSEEHVQTAKRFHAFYIMENRWQNKSDCIAFLLKKALDQIDTEKAQEEKKQQQQKQNKKKEIAVNNSA